MYTDLTNFLGHSAIKFHLLRIAGKETYASRNKFLLNQAKKVKKLPRRQVDNTVRELCALIRKTPSHASWIYDQYFHMVMDTKPCVAEHCYDLSTEVTDEYFGKTNHIENKEKFLKKPSAEAICI